MDFLLLPYNLAHGSEVQMKVFPNIRIAIFACGRGCGNGLIAVRMGLFNQLTTIAQDAGPECPVRFHLA